MFEKLPSHISRGIGVLLDANLCLYNYLIIMTSQVGAVGVCSCHNILIIWLDICEPMGSHTYTLRYLFICRVYCTYDIITVHVTSDIYWAPNNLVSYYIIGLVKTKWEAHFDHYMAGHVRVFKGDYGSKLKGKINV